MNSPFPGMDPFIEAANDLWGDFQFNLIHEIKTVLLAAVPERYLIRCDRRCYVDLTGEDGTRAPRLLPDVEIPAKPPTDEDAVSMQAFVMDEHRESFIEIYQDGEQQELVTVIEVLSPANKRPGSPGWKLYKRKRQSLLMGKANFVEIDLLRGGQKPAMLTPWPICPYTLLVSRRRSAPYCRVWPGLSLKPLPVIPVPLVKPDADFALALQPLVEAIYVRNRYHRSIDYTKPLQTLSDEEDAFLTQQLRGNSS